MIQALKYINEELGINFHIIGESSEIKNRLPLYISSYYTILQATIQNIQILLLSPNQSEELPTTGQIKKHVETISRVLNMPVLLVFDVIESYKRNRLIQYGVNFVVPFKQLYMPELLMILSETGSYESKEARKLSPMSQLLVIFWILNQDNSKHIESMPFNWIAKLFETNAMAITRAVENLETLGLCSINQGRPKSFSFLFKKRELWEKVKHEEFWINPVQKRIYIDSLPNDISWLKADRLALSEYSDMNPTQQSCFAIDKVIYHELKKTKYWPDEFSDEGEICVEIWKYNPLQLANLTMQNKDCVDPLSLYFCFANFADERIEDALDKIESNYIW